MVEEKVLVHVTNWFAHKKAVVKDWAVELELWLNMPKNMFLIVISKTVNMNPDQWEKYFRFFHYKNMFLSIRSKKKQKTAWK